MRKMLRRINKNFISLVPKTQKLTSLLDFRPISFCYTMYKILVKFLVNRIKPFLESIIGTPQKGFIKGRKILDVMITTHEIIHSMERNKRPIMTFKIDISKVYDKVKWYFLYDVLERVGFSNKVINLIKMMVGSMQYFVLLNGSP